MAVHRLLGPGLREDSYQRALANSFSDSSLAFEAQKVYSVFDDLDQLQLIGYYIPDFVVEDCVVVEIKALKGLDNSHLAQVIAYLPYLDVPLDYWSILEDVAFTSAGYFHHRRSSITCSTGNGSLSRIG